LISTKNYITNKELEENYICMLKLDQEKINVIKTLYCMNNISLMQITFTTAKIKKTIIYIIRP